MDSADNCNRINQQTSDCQQLDGGSRSAYLLSDAIGKVHIANRNALTLDVLQDLESKLDFYEKVSLTFLLYENPDVALQYLIKEEKYSTHTDSTSSLLFEWAVHTNADRWKTMLLEALCIVQNYSILRKFGHPRDELKVRFLPDNMNTSLFVDRLRKILYFMCENFTKDQANLFIVLLQDDFNKKHITFQVFNAQYMEMYLLYFLSIKYISPTNLTNLITILNKIGLSNVSNILVNYSREHNVAPSAPTASIRSQSENQRDEVDIVPVFKINSKVHNEGPFEKCSDNSVIGDNSYIKTNSLLSNDPYKIDPEHVGRCLILNQENFVIESDPKLQCLLPVDGLLSDRFGSNLDVDKLERTFKHYGFTTSTKTNVTHSSMKKEIYTATRDFTKDDSCFIVIIMSHGIKDAVYGSNSIPVYINDIEKIIQETENRHLLGKPKILIIQSCQGAPIQKAVPQQGDIKPPVFEDASGIVSDGIQYIPEKSDFLLCSSTIPGYASIRNIHKGTWYIQELCDTLMSEGHRNHFLDILTIVNNNISSKVCEKNGLPCCMVSEFKSSLRKALYLPVKVDNSEQKNKS